MSNDQIEINTSAIYDVIIESADAASQDIKRAIVKIPIISEGSNSKFLNWTQETMAKVAHMFRGVPFRYDINGQNEGSHTKDRLSSPYYDVGWTYSDERGAYYDPETKTVYVQGEVTHPDVVDKLMRQTTDGKREINYASMGALLNPPDTKCSMCGKTPFGSCSHQRGQQYGLETCSMVPTNITKALHVALTNDPADKNAVIESAIFQDMTSSVDSGSKDSPVTVAPNLPGPNEADNSDLRELIEIVLKEVLNKKRKEQEQITATADSEEAHKMEDKKKKMDKEDVKEEVEKKTTEKIDDEKESSLKPGENPDDEAKKKKKINGTDSNPKLEVAEAKEKEDEEEEDEEEEEKEEKKKKPKKHKEPDADNKGGPSDHDEDNKKEDMKEKKKEFADDDIEFKISGLTNAPRSAQKLETAESGVIVKNDIYATKYKAKLVQELADTYFKFNKAKSKEDAILVLQDKSIEQLEIYQDAYTGIEMIPEKKAAMPVFQDNTHVANKKFASEVPEFGGMEHSYVEPTLELSDMTPEQRRQSFGEFGAFDLCFNPGNAQKYKKSK